LVVKEEIFDERGFAGTATANKNRNCVLRNVFHIELPEVLAHGGCIRGHI
jgi:hypothetical protein